MRCHWLHIQSGEQILSSTKMWMMQWERAKNQTVCAADSSASWEYFIESCILQELRMPLHESKSALVLVMALVQLTDEFPAFLISESAWFAFVAAFLLLPD